MQTQAYCTECNEPCDIFLEKDYIVYEFWGETGVKEVYYQLSSCCYEEIKELVQDVEIDLDKPLDEEDE